MKNKHQNTISWY